MKLTLAALAVMGASTFWIMYWHHFLETRHLWWQIATGVFMMIGVPISILVAVVDYYERRARNGGRRDGKN